MQEDVPLIIGADGLIGRALADHLVQSGEHVLETSHRVNTILEKRIFLDLAEDISTWCSPKHVSVAYLCAAITSLEQCRNNPKQSEIVNVHNTVALAKMLVKKGVFVVFLSTNLVYDGSISFQKAEDPANPRTEYGRQKAEAEKQLLALGESVSIVRLTKVLGPNIPLFNKWIQSLQKSEPIHPFSDMVMAPVPLTFVVKVLHQIAENRLTGIFQVSGNEDITYEQAARYIAEHIGVNQEFIQPISYKETAIEFEVPSNHTTLDMSKVFIVLGINCPNVWETIDSFVSSSLIKLGKGNSLRYQ